MLALKWQDIDLQDATVSVRRTLTREGGRITIGEPKTKKSRRSISLTPRATGGCQKHLKRQLRQIEILGDRYDDRGLRFNRHVRPRAGPVPETRQISEE